MKNVLKLGIAILSAFAITAIEAAHTYNPARNHYGCNPGYVAQGALCIPETTPGSNFINPSTGDINN